MIKRVTRQSTDKGMLERVERLEKLLQKIIEALIKRKIIKDEI